MEDNASVLVQDAAASTVAAVDLGSNSFHLIVARNIDGQLHVLDRLREMVQLAAGLDARNRLSAEAQANALACLERFGQRLRGMEPGSVRAVGTNTLRRARNGRQFLAAAQRALGHPIEVISGQEEARLIYLGVAHSRADDQGRRLVMDIGGGSTELIIGERFEPLHMESLYMGCVSMSRAHFPDGVLRMRNFRQALTAARLELQPVEAYFRRIGWEVSTGASGTIRAVASVVRAASSSADDITLPALHKIRDALLAAGHTDRLQLPGLSAERVPVFPGGFVILLAAFEALGIERMGVAEGALREGLLYDLHGRIQHEDVRERTIQALTARYHLDLEQAARVEATACDLLAQSEAAWGLGDEAAHDLTWAARLHEIGLTIAHNHYHKHGAYLVENSDLPGFSRQEQELIAALIRGHRRKVPLAVFKALGDGRGEIAIKLCVLLRIAALLHRSRVAVQIPPIRLVAGKKSLSLEFPEGWLDQHPLTRADLECEAGFLTAAKFRLQFR